MADAAADFQQMADRGLSIDDAAAILSDVKSADTGSALERPQEAPPAQQEAQQEDIGDPLPPKLSVSPLRESVLRQAQTLQNDWNRLAKEKANVPWTEIRTSDPERYVLLHDDFVYREQALSERELAVRQAAVHVQSAEQEERNAQVTHYVSQEQNALLRAIPSWRDSTVKDREQQELVQYMKSELGYSQNEINSVYDHRALVTIRKAWLADIGKRQAKPDTRQGQIRLSRKVQQQSNEEAILAEGKRRHLGDVDLAALKLKAIFRS